MRELKNHFEDNKIIEGFVVTGRGDKDLIKKESDAVLLMDVFSSKMILLPEVPTSKINDNY